MSVHSPSLSSEHSPALSPKASPGTDVHLERAGPLAQTGRVSCRLEPASDQTYASALMRAENGKFYRVTLYRGSDGTTLALQREDWEERLQRMNMLCHNIFEPRDIPSTMTVGFSTGHVYTKELGRTDQYTDRVLEHQESFQAALRIGSTDTRFQASAPYDPHHFHTGSRSLSEVRNLDSMKEPTRSHSKPYFHKEEPSSRPRHASFGRDPLRRPAPVPLERDNAIFWRQNFITRLRSRGTMTVQDAAILRHHYKAKYAQSLQRGAVRPHEFHVALDSYSRWRHDPSRQRREIERATFAQYITRDLPDRARVNGDDFVIYPTGNHFVIFRFDYTNRKLEYYDPKGVPNRPVLERRGARGQPSQVLERIDPATLTQMYRHAFGPDAVIGGDSIVTHLPGSAASPQRHDDYNCLMFCYDFADRAIQAQSYNHIYQAHEAIARTGTRAATEEWSRIRNELADQIEPTLEAIRFEDLT